MANIVVFNTDILNIASDNKKLNKIVNNIQKQQIEQVKNQIQIINNPILNPSTNEKLLTDIFTDVSL